NAQAGLFRTLVARGGSAAQAAELDPLIRSFAVTGTFALTEPEHGSDIAGGMATTAERVGGEWVIRGEKRWIGAAAASDLLAVFARDRADGQVKAFLVPRTADGVIVSPIDGKIALRPMQNAVVALADVRVPDSARLARISSWHDVSAVLGALRSDVAWIATGLQAGALEAAIAYVRRREQFGRPIGGFQLVQEKLARMLGNLTASLAMVVQLSARQDAGEYRDESSALAKLQTARMARETVALGREVAGGNGLLLEHDVARFFADATDDHQWIHVDPERAANGPFGGPIAHGFFTLSLTIPMWTELLEVEGVTTKVNYGLDRVRFVSPVRVGARVRMNAVIAEVTSVPGGYQIAVDQTIEIEGADKPAVVARGLSRFYA
ncbi:MAG: acyl-CoA dehydrogenase family protein, partial [Microbacterium sp.]|nr:acyl-CoA dehydrogenase family protein [Microbacterium sp.]